MGDDLAERNPSLWRCLNAQARRGEHRIDQLDGPWGCPSATPSGHTIEPPMAWRDMGPNLVICTGFSHQLVLKLKSDEEAAGL